MHKIQANPILLTKDILECAGWRVSARLVKGEEGIEPVIIDKRDVDIRGIVKSTHPSPTRNTHHVP